MIRTFIRSMLQWRAKRRLRAASPNIHPSARVNYRGITGNPRVSIGEGSIFQGSIAGERPGAVVRIGSNTFIGGSLIACAESVTIGDDVMVSWGCTILDHHSHSLNWEERKGDVRDTYNGHKDWSTVPVQPVTIHHKAWIGFNSIILSGITIGEGAVVGCGSIVTKNVDPYTVVAGNPAKFIRSLDCIPIMTNTVDTTPPAEQNRP